MAGGSAIDGGMTDSGVDAGLLVDAGRVITVVDLDLFIQPDGGTVAYPKQGELAAALFFLTDGGELRLALDTDGGGVFSATHAPPGTWLAEVRRPAEPPVYLSVLGDRADLSQTRTSGRPGAALTQSLTLDFQLAVTQWEEGDSLELVSERAGSRIVVNPSAASGTTLLTDSLNPTLVEGAVIEPSDDVLVSQLHSTTNDAGVIVTTLVGWSALSGLSIPGSPIVGTLTTPTQFARVATRTGSLTSALGTDPILAILPCITRRQAQLLSTQRPYSWRARTRYSQEISSSRQLVLRIRSHRSTVRPSGLLSCPQSMGESKAPQPAFHSNCSSAPPCRQLTESRSTEDWHPSRR